MAPAKPTMMQRIMIARTLFSLSARMMPDDVAVGIEVGRNTRSADELETPDTLPQVVLLEEDFRMAEIKSELSDCTMVRASLTVLRSSMWHENETVSLA